MISCGRSLPRKVIDRISQVGENTVLAARCCDDICVQRSAAFFCNDVTVIDSIGDKGPAELIPERVVADLTGLEGIHAQARARDRYIRRAPTREDIFTGDKTESVIMRQLMTVKDNVHGDSAK